MTTPSKPFGRPLAIAAVAAVALLSAHCGDPVASNELPPISRDCESTSFGCMCDLEDYSEGKGLACSAKSERGTCCINEYDCRCYTLGCITDATGCTCKVTNGQGEAACSPPNGVCCARPSDSQSPCRCYFNLGVCPAGESPIGNCAISSLTCDLLGDSGEPRTACSKVVQN